MDIELEKKREGVYLAGRFSNWRVGSWVLQQDDECAVMEMPPPSFNEENPAFRMRRALDSMGLRCKYMFFSHPHWDHTASLAEYRSAFPEAKLIAHYSAPLLFKMSEYWWASGHLLPRWSPWANVKDKWGSEWFFSRFDDIFIADIYEISISREPLYLIYAPKHSLGDVHCVFKGVLFSGDWWLYEGDPCQDMAASSKAEDSIRRLVDFAIDKKYHIHTVFPAHADNLLYDIDFFHIMEKTRDYHVEASKRIKDFQEWKNFGLSNLYHYFFPHDSIPGKEGRKKKT